MKTRTKLIVLDDGTRYDVAVTGDENGWMAHALLRVDATPGRAHRQCIETELHDSPQSALHALGLEMEEGQ